jgi:hypothetical protein
VIETLQKLNFTHDILDLVVVHSIQADSLDGYSLSSRIVEGFVNRSKLTFTDTFTQRLELASSTAGGTHISDDIIFGRDFQGDH